MQPAIPQGLLDSRARGHPWRGKIPYRPLPGCGEGIEAFLAHAARRSLRCRAAVLQEDGAYVFSVLPAVPASVTPGDWLRFDHVDRTWQSVHRGYAAICEGLRMRPSNGVTVFLHGAGAHVPPHVDSTGGLVLHVEGERSWMLAPPGRPGEGEFDALRPQPWGVPRRPGAIECELGPAEWLFVPAGWWHETRSSAPSMVLRFSLGIRASAMGA